MRRQRNGKLVLKWILKAICWYSLMAWVTEVAVVTMDSFAALSCNVASGTLNCWRICKEGTSLHVRSSHHWDNTCQHQMLWRVPYLLRTTLALRCAHVLACIEVAEAENSWQQKVASGHKESNWQRLYSAQQPMQTLWATYLQDPPSGIHKYLQFLCGMPSTRIKYVNEPQWQTAQNFGIYRNRQLDDNGTVDFNSTRTPAWN